MKELLFKPIRNFGWPDFWGVVVAALLVAYLSAPFVESWLARLPQLLPYG